MDASADIRALIAAARRGVPEAIGRLFEAARADLMQIADRELPEEVRAKVGRSTPADQKRRALAAIGTLSGGPHASDVNHTQVAQAR